MLLSASSEIARGAQRREDRSSGIRAMLTGKDILCLSSIDWEFVWQGHQEIMATLAGHGNRVLFVENTGVRSARFRDLSRLGQRIRSWWRGTKGFRQERENLFVYSPLILPFPYSRIARRVNRAVILRALGRWMRATAFQRPIIWSFLPTPLSRDLIRALDSRLTIYYCIDDLASSSPPARRVGKSEVRLFREADLVFVTSEKLRERASRYSDRVHLFPFGVDFGSFERVRNAPDEIPADLRELSRPIVGYVGGMHQWIDQELVAGLAAGMPEVSFAMVGPLQTDVSRLARCPNIHLLGMRSHAELPRYIKGFDVGIVPYRLSEYTASVYPTKLNEYLAMGIPVVATGLPEVRRFNAEHENVVAVAADVAAFGAAIRTAVGRASPGESEQRIAVARSNSWAARIGRMSDLIEETLTVRRTAGDGWEETLRREYRTARRRVTRFAAAIAALYLFVFYTPFVWLAAEPLRVATVPSVQADAIVIFAGGVGESGKAGGGAQERVKQAIDLYHAGRAPRAIFSSGYVFALREAEVMREVASAHGVPASAIILEAKAANTFENVTYVRDILHRGGWRRILLVSSPYHMRRALLTWRKVAPEIDVIPAPVPNSEFYTHGLGASLEQIRGILHEYVAIAVYRWKGWI